MEPPPRIRTPPPKEDDESYESDFEVSSTDFESPTEVIHLGTPAAARPRKRLCLGIAGLFCLTIGLNQQIASMIVFGLITIMIILGTGSI